MTDIEGRDDLHTRTREGGVEDVARAGEGAPGGAEIGEVVAGTAGDRERRVARTGVEHAISQAARGDREGSREAGLRTHLQDAVTVLGDTAGGADDGLEREPGQERRDVRQAGGSDRIDRDRTRGNAEVDAPFDHGDRADVLGGGHDAAGPDGEHPGAAETGRMITKERADGGNGRTAVIIEDQAREGVVAEKIKDRAAVERDDVRGGDLAGDRVRRGSHVHCGAIEDEPVGGNGGGGNDRTRRRGDEIDGASVDHRAAGIGGQGVGQIEGAPGGGNHQADRGIGAADWIVDDARIERHGVRTIEEIEVAGRGG